MPIGLRACAVIAVIAVLVVACDGGAPGRLSMTTDTATSAAAKPIASATPTARALPKRVDAGPHAVSFISADEGWALLQGDCRTCSRLVHTTTGGRRWSVLARPKLPGPDMALYEGLIDMFFVDRRTGYLFAAYECHAGCVLVTRDGGRSWQTTTLPPVLQMVTGQRFVYLLANSTPRPTVLRTAIDSDRWAVLPIQGRAMPPRSAPDARPLPVIAAVGNTIAVLRRSPAGTSPTPAELGALWVSTDSGQQWSQRPNPCLTRDGGAALVSIALADPAAFLLDCFDNEQSQQAQATQHHLYRSLDAGRHWTRVGDPARQGDPVLLADNGDGHAFLATESGGGDMLTATFDGAAHWHTAVASGGSFYGWADLRFVNATTGFVLGPTHYAPEHLYRTDDGGRSWHIVPVHAHR